MRSSLWFICLFGLTLAALASGCGHDGPRVASLTLRAENAQDGEVPCPLGQGVRVTAEARDANGDPFDIDPSALQWSSSDAATIEVSSSADGSATLTARRDWFDGSLQAEPSSTVTARYGDVMSSLAARGVINATGTWSAALDLGFTYTLVLTQSGRTVVDADTGYTGTVSGNALDLDISGFAVRTTFSSRTEVSGTYSGPSGLSGTLVCTKQ